MRGHEALRLLVLYGSGATAKDFISCDQYLGGIDRHGAKASTLFRRSRRRRKLHRCGRATAAHGPTVVEPSEPCPGIRLGGPTFRPQPPNGTLNSVSVSSISSPHH